MFIEFTFGKASFTRQLIPFERLKMCGVQPLRLRNITRWSLIGNEESLYKKIDDSSISFYTEKRKSLHENIQTQNKALLEGNSIFRNSI